MKLVVINGPNLNLTGMRSPNVYGTDTLETITEELNGYVISCGSELAAFQSNHEGDIIDAIHAAMNEFESGSIHALFLCNPRRNRGGRTADCGGSFERYSCP